MRWVWCSVSWRICLIDIAEWFEDEDMTGVEP